MKLVEGGGIMSAMLAFLILGPIAMVFHIESKYLFIGILILAFIFLFTIFREK